MTDLGAVEGMTFDMALDAWVASDPQKEYSRERQRGWDEAIATVRAIRKRTTLIPEGAVLVTEDGLARALADTRLMREWASMESIADAIEASEGPDSYAASDTNEAAIGLRHEYAAAILRHLRET